MPALINWNVVSSRLRRYLFNNETESNWLCRRGKRAWRQASTSSFFFFNRTQPFLEGSETQSYAPHVRILLSVNTTGIFVSMCRISPVKGQAADDPGSVPSHCPGQLYCSASAECLPASSQRAAAELCSQFFSPVFLARKNLNYPYK